MLNDRVKNQLLSLSGLPKDPGVEEQECCEWGRDRRYGSEASSECSDKYVAYGWLDQDSLGRPGGTRTQLERDPIVRAPENVRRS